MRTIVRTGYQCGDKINVAFVGCMASSLVSLRPEWCAQLREYHVIIRPRGHMYIEKLTNAVLCVMYKGDGSDWVYWYSVVFEVTRDRAYSGRKAERR
jgi:hypothetical protein